MPSLRSIPRGGRRVLPMLLIALTTSPAAAIPDDPYRIITLSDAQGEDWQDEYITVGDDATVERELRTASDPLDPESSTTSVPRLYTTLLRATLSLIVR